MASIETYLGKDNVVHVVKVCTSNGIYKRPTAKIVLQLPNDKDSRPSVFVEECSGMRIDRYRILVVVFSHRVRGPHCGRLKAYCLSSRLVNWLAENHPV